MSKRRRGLRGLAAASTLAASASLAQIPEVTPSEPDPQASYPTNDLEGLSLAELLSMPVVTASGGASEERALAAANVVSIGKDEIAARGFRSVAEILQWVPGLYVIDNYVLPSVSVRGVTGGLAAGSRIIKVMIDGVQVNFRPDLTAFIGPEFIPVEAIERIEVAKGPLSALYGANAFLATVNIITKSALKGRETGFNVRGSALRTQDHGFANTAGAGASAIAQIGTGNVGMLVSFTAERTDRSGLRIQRTFERQDPSQARYAPFFGDHSRGDITTPWGVYAQLAGESERLGSLTLRGGYQQLAAVGEFQLNSVLTHRSQYALHNFWTNARYTKRWSEYLSMWLSGGVATGAPNRGESFELTGNRTSSFRRNVDYLSGDVSAGLDITIAKIITLTLGGDYTREQHTFLHYTQTFNAPQGIRQPGDQVRLVSPGDLIHASFGYGGAYLQLAASPLERLRISGTVRVDKPGLFDVQTSWRAAVAYRWSPAVATKLIVGRAYQAPSMSLLYARPGFGTFEAVVGARTLVDPVTGNARVLSPQSVQSIEAVVSANLGPYVTLEGAVYGQMLEQRIEFVRVGSFFVAANRGTEYGLGGELTARAAIKRFAPYIQLAYHRTLPSETNPDVSPPPLYPEWMGMAGLAVDVPEAKLRVNGNTRFSGARGSSQANAFANNGTPYQLPPYALLDLSLTTAGLRLIGNHETRFGLHVRNLLDTRYNEPAFGGFDLPSLGRTVMLEIRQDL